ncbi:MAG: von Willebrand factor type A domain-containing protein [Bacteroidota bacterium]
MNKLPLILLLGSFLLLSACSKDDNESLEPGLLGNPTNFSYAQNGPGYTGYMGTAGESYNEIEENPFILTTDEAISTFSIDADGGSYSNTRRFIENGSLPPIDAIRTEEFVNFFPFDYLQPAANIPIGLNGEISDCPWENGHKLVRIGIQGKDIPRDQQAAANFVLLIDVSGSMNNEDKLGLLQTAFNLFVDEMRATDRLAIVTYAGADQVLLPSTPGTDKDAIKAAINKLTAGGGTNGAGGIFTAYEIAEQNFITGGNNRIILGTDGDFNIGPSSQDELIDLIEEKRESGVFLSVLGVGTGNLNEGMMEQLANNGNGNFEYIDSELQAQKVMVDEFSKFYTIAKDVKVQIEFNPQVVEQYRLIGYENRVLDNEDFEDDTKDAGEIGGNQSITALYELIPVPNINYKDYNTFTVDFRYKDPDANSSQALQLEVVDYEVPFAQASENQRFAAVAAGFALILRDSPYKGNLSYRKILNWLDDAQTYDPNAYRQELEELIKKAKAL